MHSRTNPPVDNSITFDLDYEAGHGDDETILDNTIVIFQAEVPGSRVAIDLRLKLSEAIDLKRQLDEVLEEIQGFIGKD